MNILVESLKRLYISKKLSFDQIKERVEKGSINKEQFKYITGELYSEEN